MRDSGTLALVNEPYSSTPLAAIDTSHVALRQFRAALEGAGGWRVGRWAIGIAAGYDTRSTRSFDSPYLRRNRAVSPALTVGIARAFREGALQAGIVGRRRSVVETFGVTEQEIAGFHGVVYKLEGYRDVPPIDVASAFTNRSRTQIQSAGIALSGLVRAVNWTLFADVISLDQRLSGIGSNTDADTWESSGIRGGATWRAAAAEGRVIATIDLRYTAISGSSEYLTRPAGDITSNERSLLGSANLRLLTGPDRWMASLSGSASSTRRTLRNLSAAATSRVDAYVPSMTLEVGRSISRQLSVAGGTTFSMYVGSGSYPSTTGRGVLYRELFAPELDLATSMLRLHAVSAAITWKSDTNTSFYLSGASQWMTATGVNDPALLSSTRRGVRLTGGVTLGIDDMR